MGKGGGATCECGQVLFEIAGRKEGDKLTCPWCERSYRYLGGEKIELIGTKDEVEEAESEKKKEKKEKKAEKDDSAEKSSRKKKSEKNRDEEESEETERKAEKKDKEKETKERAKEAKSERIEVPKRSGRETRREEKVSQRTGPPEKQKVKKKEIPGGTTMMIVFIIGFNALAFLALAIVMPTEGAVRKPLWGGEVPKSAVWPELLALLLGHVVGFVAWSWYVYQLVKLKQIERQSDALEKSVEQADRK